MGGLSQEKVFPKAGTLQGICFPDAERSPWN